MRTVTPSRLQQTYDYLIVGSGPAGLTLAQALQPAGRVLVLEAGTPHRGPLSMTPAYYPRSFGSRIDWNYQTAPQSELANRKIAWPSGKTLGGSSAINAMIRIEPADHCLQELQTACGSDWLIESSRSFFQELRRIWQGSAPELHPNTSALLEIAIANSVGSRNAIWRPSHTISPYLRMQAHGRRRIVDRLTSSRNQNATSQNSFDALTSATVKRVLLESDRVTGLLADVEGEEFQLRANKQVILCCGAIETPRLLFQSGIGPKEPLARAGLSCTHPSERIGSGLQDHLVYPLVFSLRDGQSFSFPFAHQDRLRYLQGGLGPKSSNLAELGAFIDPDGNPRNSFQWHITPTHYLAYPRISIPHPCISIGITQSKPQSTGTILPERIDPMGFTRSCDSGRVALLIDPRYLSESDDWEAFKRAIDWSREFFHQPLWQVLLDEELAPGLKRSSDESLRNHFERFATTLYHYSGSCAMGLDPSAPVDPRFTLRGIDGLRICDASVFPSILGCNPQTTIMMLAMRLASWLIEES